jgi:ribosomal protein S8
MKIKLAYLISSINSGILNKSFSVEVPYSSLNFEVLNLLLKQNLINNFVFQNGKFEVFLRYFQGKGVMRRINLVSRLKRFIYMNKSSLKNTTRSGNISGFYVISTPQGLVTHFESLNLEDNLGGEVLLKITL